MSLQASLRRSDHPADDFHPARRHRQALFIYRGIGFIAGATWEGYYSIRCYWYFRGVVVQLIGLGR